MAYVTDVRSASKAVVLGACVVVAMATIGCANKKVISINSTAEFNEKVLKSDKPVFVHFYKFGCALCAMLAPIENDLADEYDGRVVFANYQLMNFVFIVRNKELREKYDVSVYPTAVLIVNGEVKKKWVAHYNKRDFRKAIDDVLAARTQPASSQPASSQPVICPPGPPDSAPAPAAKP